MKPMVFFKKLFLQKKTKKQYMIRFLNLGVISKYKIVVLTQGKEYLNSVEENIKDKIIKRFENILAKPAYLINTAEIEAKDAAEIILAYDHFAKYDRKNFPKTAEQIKHLENEKIKQNAK